MADVCHQRDIESEIAQATQTLKGEIGRGTLTFHSLIHAWAEASPCGQEYGDKEHVAQDLRSLARGVGSAVEVGPGTGVNLRTLLTENSQMKLVAIDLFKTQLDAVASALQLPPDQLKLVQGDMRALMQLLDENHIPHERLELLLYVHLFYYLVYCCDTPDQAQALMNECLAAGIDALPEGGKLFAVLKDKVNGNSSQMYKHFHGKPFELDLAAAAETIRQRHGQEVDVDCQEHHVEARCASLVEATKAALLVLLHAEKESGAPERFDFRDRIGEVVRWVAENCYDTALDQYVIKQRQWHLTVTKKKKSDAVAAVASPAISS